MLHDLEPGHGVPEELAIEPVARPLRPLTTDEKIAATRIDVGSRAASSTTPAESVDNLREDELVPRPLARLRELELLLDRKLGVESDAIERKLPGDRSQPLSRTQLLSIVTHWTSATLNVAAFAAGFIGRWQLAVSLKQSIAVCVVGSLAGGAASAFCATFGAATGLRQTSVARYSIGWYPSKLIAVLNVTQRLGWSALASVVGAAALSAASNGHMPLAVGVVVVDIAGFAVSLFGLRTVLAYERYAWVACLIVIVSILAETSRDAYSIANPPDTASTDAGNALSLLSIAYGASVTWTTAASDYHVHLPADISRTTVFLLSWFGIAIPTALAIVAGCVASSAARLNHDWHVLYEDQGTGAVMQAMLHPHSFASFLLVILGLSAISANVVNTYSAALSCQQFARPLAEIPRFVWNAACFVCIAIVSLAGGGGEKAMLPALPTLLTLLGYLSTSYFAIVLVEHCLFRRGRFENYNLEAWNNPAALPLGLAAAAAFAVGAGAWVVAMADSFYVGPLAALVGGTKGGDVAAEFTFAITPLVYIPLRFLELRFWRR